MGLGQVKRLGIVTAPERGPPATIRAHGLVRSLAMREGEWGSDELGCDKPNQNVPTTRDDNSASGSRRKG